MTGRAAGGVVSAADARIYAETSGEARKLIPSGNGNQPGALVLVAPGHDPGGRGRRAAPLTPSRRVHAWDASARNALSSSRRWRHGGCCPLHRRPTHEAATFGRSNAGKDVCVLVRR